MDDDKLFDVSYEDLEKEILSELKPEDLEAAVKEDPPESAPEEGTKANKQAPEETREKSGNLTKALQEERDKTRREREQRIALEARLDQLERLMSGKQEPETETEDEIDPYLDTPEFVKRETEKTKKELQGHIQRMQAQMAGELIKTKITLDEEELKKAGELKEYHELVNMRDEDHFFYQHCKNNPGLLERLYADPRPAKAALDEARKARMKYDPEYARTYNEKLEKDLEKKILKRLMDKMQNKSSGAKGPVGISGLSSSTGGKGKDITNLKHAKYEDIERAIFEDD